MRPDESEEAYLFRRRQEKKEFYLEGKPVEEFIAEMANSAPRGSSYTPYDKAYILQDLIDLGVIEEREIARAVGSLGLAADEAAVFINQTMPQIREYREQQRKKDAQAQLEAQTELARVFTQSWGLDRLDATASHFVGHAKDLARVNPYWQDAIQRYQNLRGGVERELQQLADPMAQVRVLMSQWSQLTYFRPSEIEQVFDAEQSTKSFAYIDGLRTASVAMYQTNLGKDPIVDTYQLGRGVSVTLRVGDNPNHQKLWMREEALHALPFGANKANEVSRPWSRKIYPLRPGPVATAPPER